MKKVFFSFIILFVIIFAFVQKAEAHFLATDKNIGAVLHVDPNDQPVAGSQASFFFEFKDKQNKFTPAKCDCIFEIDENGQSIFSQPLFQNNSNPGLSTASVFYTFPKIDVYQVKVIGKPLPSGAFQPFTLTWNFRVDQEANPQASVGNNTNFFTTHLVHFLGFGILALCFLIYIVYNIFHKKHSTRKGGEKKDDKEDIRDIF